MPIGHCLVCGELAEGLLAIGLGEMKYAVYCNEHGQTELSQQEYERQMSMPEAMWVCPICRMRARWDDEVYEAGLMQLGQSG